MAIVVKFVTAVGADGTGGTTRLDLSPIPDAANDGTRVQIADGYEFPRPALITTTTEDGRPIAADYAATRTLTLPLLIGDRATANQRRAALTALARELDRDRNVLYIVADGASEGRWLTTYRAADAADNLRLIGGWDIIPVKLTADAFALGPQVIDSAMSWTDFDGSVTAGFGTASSDHPGSEGSPSSALGQWYKQTPAISGDVDTPATVTIWPITSQSITQDVLIATAPVRFETFDTVRFFSQVTAVSPATPQTSTGASGGSAARYAPADALERPIATVPGVPDIVAGGTFGVRQTLGQWRIWWRVKRSVAGDVWTLRCKGDNGFSNGPLLTPIPQVFANPVGAGWAWVDGGIISAPVGRNVFDSPFGDPLRISESIAALYAARTSGSGTLDVDYAFFVPADYSTLYIEAPTVLDADRLVIDADVNDLYRIRDFASGGGYYYTAAAPTGWRGGIPMLSARYPTRLFISVDMSSNNVLTKTLNVQVSYRPRYLTVV